MYPGMFLFFMNEPVIGAISFFNLLLIVLLQFLPNVILVVCESFLNIYFVFNFHSLANIGIYYNFYWRVLKN